MPGIKSWTFYSVFYPWNILMFIFTCYFWFPNLFFFRKDDCCLFGGVFCHQLFILPTMRITFYFPIPAAWDPKYRWISRVESLVNQMFHGFLLMQTGSNPQSTQWCFRALRGGSIPHPACSGQENSSCQEFCIKSSQMLAHGPGGQWNVELQAVTGLQIVFSAALHSSVQNIRHNWRFIEVLGFVWSHSSFPNYHLGLKYWWLCIARGLFCVAY